MNRDTIQEILLNLSYKDTLSLCSANQDYNSICNNQLWKLKMLKDYDTIVINNAKQEYNKMYKSNIKASKLMQVLKQIKRPNHEFSIYFSLPFDRKLYNNQDLVWIIVDNNKTLTLFYGNIETTDEIEIQSIISKILYHHPDIIVKDFLSTVPIMYDDLLAFNDAFYYDIEKNKRISAWKSTI